MKEIEKISDPTQLMKAIIDNNMEFDLSKLFTIDEDYPEAIALITQKQIIMQPVYLSHPLVAINVLKTILPEASFSFDIRMMHSELMKALNDYQVAMLYIQKQRHLIISTPNEITEDLNKNIELFLERFFQQEYAKSFIFSVGDYSYEKINLLQIKSQLDLRRTGKKYQPTNEIVLLTRDEELLL